MSDEFTLTDAQVENWRTLLLTMPIPPLNMSLGIYAAIMPRDQVVRVAEALINRMNKELPKEPSERTSANITRTRPRKPGKPVRR